MTNEEQDRFDHWRDRPTGGAVIRHMLPKGWKLRGLTRDAGSNVAQELARQGIEVVRGDLEDPASLEKAIGGVYGVYSVQDFWSVGARREVRQGKNLADAAKKLASSISSTARSAAPNAIRGSATGRASERSSSTFAISIVPRRFSGPLDSWKTTTSARSTSGF